MFSRMKIAASTGSCSDKIKRLKDASVVIGAVVIGAGLSGVGLRRVYGTVYQRHEKT